MSEMTWHECPECGKKFFRKSKECPYCARKGKEKPKKKNQRKNPRLHSNSTFYYFEPTRESEGLNCRDDDRWDYGNI